VDGELLVGVPICTGPDLQLLPVGVVPVRHVEALVVECLDGASERCEGRSPVVVAVGEVGPSVADAAAEEDDGCAVGVGSGADAEGLAANFEFKF
jgi:hypothetical protein